MKKTISFLLVLVLIISCFSLTALAESNESKIEPSLLEIINNKTDGGTIIEITHNNPKYPIENVPYQEALDNYVSATNELCKEIEKITTYENPLFTPGKLFIGVPYSAILKIAEIETVEYIKIADTDVEDLNPAENKLADEMKKALKDCDADSEMNICIALSYSSDVYLGFTEKDFNTAEEYRLAKIKARSKYFTENNQRHFDEISKTADITLNRLSTIYPSIFVSTTADEILKIASLSCVSEIIYIDPEPTPMPTETEKDNYLFDFAFEKWMYDGPHHVKKYDETTDVDRTFKYFDYDELYYHFGEFKGFPDWALITAKVDEFELWEVYKYLRIEDKFLTGWRAGQIVYPYALFVYDAKEDTFFAIEDADISRYDGLLDVIVEKGFTTPAGDADNDGELTVIDATYIQKYKAQLIKEDKICVTKADIDNDGDVTVIDATCIQKTLASVE